MEKNKFWKYFGNTIKESKWLLLGFFLEGIFLFIVGIITNKLQLDDLTFYNAMITICYLGEMISFGFSEGFGIYINQNIKDKDCAKKFAKIGLYFTFGFISILAIVFIIASRFITKNILNLDFEINYTFYVLMVICMVIVSINSYITLLLRKLGEFKYKLFTTIFQGVILIVGLLGILAFKKLFLIPIAISYICIYTCCIVFSSIVLARNKILKINIFKPEKLHLTRQEFGVVVSRAMSEIVWEIGYLFLSLFILKANVITYNQYCFFENALDILGGLFFAFVNVVAIKICRAIGEGNKEEAYQHAKLSIKSSIVIWFIYAVITLILFIPIRNAMNIELRDTALIAVLLYIGATLFRFVEYNLGTYILGQSEYFANGALVIEICAMLFWIIMFIIADYIVTNVFVIFTLIMLENLVKSSIGLIVVRKKKWLEKSN